ncbi:amyloid fiber anchoring/assembly protein TapA [Evansella sp. AB-P1]|uniref:amyloid fiber anchoring/assembly protein TapA n=1 Tax=Evansella sp. AB-P1 TaxID=3037653 RepID=UPI00241FAF5C|nr:amyloid fiber anchoring/assembly protein TapA [Evansella sp. AB-P1]MDG5787700.1 amyloid fiber anchoring/assembly protein TapA [Evansella sp. AB-P1]
MVRSSRFKMYRRKYSKLVICTKLLIIWYALVVSMSLLTSGTEAYYSNYSETKTIISSAEYWWDKSNLDFINEDDQQINECNPIIITLLKNVGADMTGETEYEVYFVEDGDPQQNGTIIHSGEFDPLDEGAVTELMLEVEEDGIYQFKVYQRKGYNHDYDNRTEIWSEKVYVTCSIETIDSIEVEEDIEQSQNDSSESKEQKEEEVDTSSESRDDEQMIDEKQEEQNKKEENKETEADQELEEKAEKKENKKHEDKQVEIVDEDNEHSEQDKQEEKKEKQEKEQEGE